ncbi:MAG: hypothetical protein JW821_04675 [Deltaproteobacteria bacterium]|nr:hypothetical protein [Deltaproteobacteria bacterium]
MEGMTTSGKILSQDDIDSILDQGGNALEDSEECNAVAHRAPAFTPEISKEAFQRILEDLYRRGALKRETGVTVIWNAHGNFPMASGVKMSINGMDYVSLGVLYDQHLVLECRNLRGEAGDSR